MKVKTTIADGQEVAFELALTMPTKQELHATILGMVLSVGSQIASQVTGPASQLASQIQQLSEKKEGEPAPAPST